MSNNYKTLVLEKIDEYGRNLPEYSFCEILYSIMSACAKVNGGKFEKNDLINSMSDKEMYKAITIALNNDIEDNKEFIMKPKYDLRDNVDILAYADAEFWDTTLGTVHNIQNSFDRESIGRLEYIIIKKVKNG